MKKLIFCLMSFLPGILYAQVNFIENTTIKTEKALISTPVSDFGPAFVGNEFWFSSFLAENIERLNQGKSKDIFYNIFSSPVDDSGNIIEGKKLILEELSAGYHAGPVGYCFNTDELFLTLSNYENAEVKNVVFQKKSIPLKIIILERNGNNWKKTGELPFNSPSYSVGHPSASVTGDTLIFASDIAGKGAGKTDLYMSIRKDGKWGDMINLGNKINTQGDDMFPYLHKGKILFFASNEKPGGKGGFDLWYSVLTENGFSDPLNFSALNSSEDDFGLVVHSDEEYGYFVSNRGNENKDDDIYQVFFTGEYNLELLVKDRKTQEPVANAKVEFSDNIIAATDDKGIVRRDLVKSTDYSAVTKLDGYKNESVAFTTKNQDYGTIHKELEVEKVEIGQKFVMNNIYYQFNKWDILNESAAELDKLVRVLTDNPSWKIELSSHTDCRGTNEYNDFLSQKRAESTVNYITGKGIISDRIIAKGYGEEVLLNHCRDGIRCTEEEHRLNRRTEFKILETE
ncbi:MAG: OmpA family protein [Bacteroidota bacterium]